MSKEFDKAIPATVARAKKFLEVLDLETQIRVERAECDYFDPFIEFDGTGVGVFLTIENDVTGREVVRYGAFRMVGNPSLGVSDTEDLGDIASTPDQPLIEAIKELVAFELNNWLGREADIESDIESDIECVEATIRERGNGLPDVGDYVAGDDGQLYEVVETTGGIHCSPSGSGGGTYMHARVRLADWDDLSDDEADDVTCTATLSE